MRGKGGFTLIEVMIAVAITGVIMTLIWSSSGQSLRAKERVENRDMVFHAGGVALRKLSEDLVMAFVVRTAAAAATSAAQTGEGTTPVEGTAAAVPAVFKTFFIGKDEGEADSLSFTSLSHLRLFKNAKESDQCKVAYEIVDSSEVPGRKDLVRREDPWLDATAEVKGAPLTLVEGVKSFEVEYYDQRKGEWAKNWNTEQQDWKDRLPLAARVTLTFADPNDEEQTIPMSTAVMIPLARNAIDF